MSMKINKPSYNPGLKLYTCELTDGFRLSFNKEEGVITQLSDSESLIQSLLQPLIDGTKGWFTKPLVKEWLQPRISFDTPTSEIPADFEGIADYQATKLIISKDSFVFQCSILELKPVEKVIIDFKEEAVDAVGAVEAVEAFEEAKEEIPLVESTPLGIGPTRRILQKEVVMKARAKAARALFKAERLTLEYSQLYGEDTDWENEGSETDN
jgi:hypothetical protein